MDDIDIEPLDEPEVGYLIGYNEDENKEEKFAVDVNTLKRLCQLVKSSIESDSSHNKHFYISSPKRVNPDDPDSPIDITTIANSVVAKWIADFINHYAKVEYDPPEIKKPICSVDMSDILLNAVKNMEISEQQKKDEVEWGSKMFNIKTDMAFNIILSCNYLDITTALHMTCAYVASKVKGKSPDEMRELLDNECKNFPKITSCVNKNTST